jgi:EmrB/QacA subfamily drug resistance transporter
MEAVVSKSVFWTVAALCAAQFVLILDVVIINVALPAIRADLGLLDSRVSLAGTAYTVTFGSLLIVSGRAGDRLGRRALLLAGLGVFVTASLLAGLSRVDWQLFTARGLQGVGAAMVSANALAAITAGLPEGSVRNRALGVWAAVGSAGAVAGQFVGGAVTEFLGWRWIFLINVPVGVAVVAALAVLLPDDRHRDRVERATDLAGAALLTTGLVAALLALTWVDEPASRGRAIVAAAFAVAALAAFATVERRAPLLRVGLLRLPGVRTANVTLLLNAGALGASMFFVTLYLQVVLGLSAFAVGLAFAPVTLLILLLSPRVATLTGRLGVRRPLTAGLTLLAAGALLLARMPVDGDYLTDVLPGMLLLAVGSALAYAPTFIAASSGVGPNEHGAASGLVNSAQELGAAVGLATLALVANRWTPDAGDPAALAAGYRAGLVAAAGCFAVAALVAAAAPRSLGRVTEDQPA